MFVFFDTETSGLDRDFSQILQIALVFTDDNLNILASKTLECRRSPWVVPSPGALLINGFSPDDLKFNELSHYEMMQEVNDWIRGHRWPLTFVGYNSLGFDEPLLAQNLHQNLLDPDLTASRSDENGQSNGRADVMILVKAVAMYMPDVLTLDIKNDFGTPSLSLINVAQQNGVALSDDDAHDAMNDIRATVGVAKLLQKAAPQVWDQMMKLSTVEGVNDFLGRNVVFTYANSGYGRSKAGVMTSLAEREGSSTQALFDLSIDPKPYLDMTAEQLKNVFLSKDKKKPFLLMRKNSQPMLMPMELSEAALPDGYEEALFAARAKTIQSNKPFLENVAKAALLAKQAQTPALSSPAPELMIGQKVDAAIRGRLEAWVEEFHCAEQWKDKAVLAGDFHVRFKAEIEADPALSRFGAFATRMVFEHAPEELGADKQEALKKSIAAQTLSPDLKVPYMTVAKARKELEQIEQERAQGKKKWAHATDGQIRSLKLYYTAIEKEYAAYAPPPANDNAMAPKQANPVKKQGPKL